jgi:hydrogenase nickel incorporation protein HypB
MMKVPVVAQVLKANDQIAAENRIALDAAGVCAVNVMASPGAGKTSLILATFQRLPSGVRAGVIEGDIASTVDADLLAAHGIPVVQINTGGNCHLDAPMIRAALGHLDLVDLDVVFIENVGNLICPANYDLGAGLAVVVASVPEGHDKPFKYPGMFASADIVLLNKHDMSAAFDFDEDAFVRGVRLVNPEAPIEPVSCRTGAGLSRWVELLLDRIRAGSAASGG